MNVLAFGLGLAVFTGVLFGVAPAIHGVRVNITTVLNQGGRRGGRFGRSHHRLRASLVTAQLALTFVLLIGAGLLVRTFLELRSVDPGFRAEGATAARMFLDARRYRGLNVSLYFRTLLEEVRTLPGVTDAGSLMKSGVQYRLYF